MKLEEIEIADDVSLDFLNQKMDLITYSGHPKAYGIFCGVCF